MGLKKKIVLLCKDIYFSIPCVKYSRACGYKYYKEIPRADGKGGVTI